MSNEHLDRFIKLAKPHKPAMPPYDAGYDCEKNGANETNCHFSLFGTRESTQEWERGKRAAGTEEPT